MSDSSKPQRYPMAVNPWDKPKMVYGEVGPQGAQSVASPCLAVMGTINGEPFLCNAEVGHNGNHSFTQFVTLEERVAEEVPTLPTLPRTDEPDKALIQDALERALKCCDGYVKHISALGAKLEAAAPATAETGEKK